MVQAADVQDLEGIWKRYQPWWIRRMPGDAYHHVKCEVARRATRGRECARSQANGHRQMTIKEVATDDDEPF